MARSIHKLTALQVKQAKDGQLGDGGGLYLRTRNGSSAWVFRCTVEGKPRQIGLGSAIDVPLSTAREMASSMRAALAKGELPAAPRASTRGRGNATALITGRRQFKAAATDYIDLNQPHWKSIKHGKQWWSTLSSHAAALMDKPVQEITVTDLNAVLAPIWTTRPETARRVRQRIERILSREIALGNRPAPNPAAWRDVLEHVLPRHRAAGSDGYKTVPPEEAQALFARIWERQVTSFAASGVALAALTALRSGEIRQLDWSMVDADSAIITIPGELMKAGREHRVPLSRAALTLLGQTPRTASPLVFPGARGGAMSDMTLLAVHRRLKVPYAIHGWRSCFRTHLAEQGVNSDALEFALAHSLPKLTAAYMRQTLFEQRKTIMEQWGSWLASGVFHIREAGQAVK